LLNPCSPVPATSPFRSFSISFATNPKNSLPPGFLYTPPCAFLLFLSTPQSSPTTVKSPIQGVPFHSLSKTFFIFSPPVTNFPSLLQFSEIRSASAGFVFPSPSWPDPSQPLAYTVTLPLSPLPFVLSLDSNCLFPQLVGGVLD